MKESNNVRDKILISKPDFIEKPSDVSSSLSGDDEPPKKSIETIDLLMINKTQEQENPVSQILSHSDEVIPFPTETGAKAHTEHKLQDSWTFWWDKKPSKRSKLNKYEENLVKLGTFSTIEEFWSFYTFLKKPSQIPKDSNYHLFRFGMKPMWESFPYGGCFLKKIKKTEDHVLNRMWEELLLATIGEMFEDPDIVGIALNIRPREDIVSIWDKSARNTSLKTKIRRVLSEIWQMDPQEALDYKLNSIFLRDRLKLPVGDSGSHSDLFRESIDNNNLEEDNTNGDETHSKVNEKAIDGNVKTGNASVSSSGGNDTMLASAWSPHKTNTISKAENKTKKSQDTSRKKKSTNDNVVAPTNQHK